MDKVEILESLQLYADKIARLVEVFRKGSVGQVNEIIELTEELKKWLIVLVEQNNFGIDQDIYLPKVTSVLQELILSLENTDYVLLADVLEYEALELIQEWLKIVKEG